MHKIWLFLLLNTVFSLCSCIQPNVKGNSVAESTVSQHPTQKKLTRVNLVDTVFDNHHLIIDAVDDTLLHALMITGKDTLQATKKAEEIESSLNLRYRGLISLTEDSFKVEQFHRLTDSVFLFSIEDFKGRIKVYGIKYADGRLSFFETNKPQDYGGTIQAGMQYVLLYNDSTIVGHSFNYLEEDHITSYRFIYIFRVRDNHFQSVQDDSFKLRNNEIDEDLFSVDTIDLYAQFYRYIVEKYLSN